MSSGAKTIFEKYFKTYTNIPKISHIRNKGNRYELYVYALVYRGIELSGSKLIPKKLQGGVFIFRNSPGLITDDFSFFVFKSAKNLKLELRNGIEYIGYVTCHEVDISVKKSEDPRTNFRPYRDTLKLGVECKNFKSSSGLKGEVRKHWGAIIDLKNTSSKGHHHILGFHFDSYFCSNVSLGRRSGSLVKYLNNYDLNHKFSLRPGSVEETDFINEIQSIASNW